MEAIASICIPWIFCSDDNLLLFALMLHKYYHMCLGDTDPWYHPFAVRSFSSLDMNDGSTKAMYRRFKFSVVLDNLLVA